MITGDLHGKKILFLAWRFYEYPEKIKEMLENMGAEVTYYNAVPSASHLAMKFFTKFGFMRSNYEKKILMSEKGKEYDYLFVINPALFDSSFLSKIVSEVRFYNRIAYLWDSISTFPNVINSFSNFDKVYSFDLQDCENNRCISFLPLFYLDELKNERGKKAYKYDFCFVGFAHTKRYQFLKEIREFANKNNFSYCFKLYLPSSLHYIYGKYIKRYYPHEKKDAFIFKSLSQKEIKKITDASEIVVDMELKNQNGLTMRTIEALGMKKKLITTNPNVKKYDFYNCNNILVVDRENPHITMSFVNCPYQDIDNSIYESYSLSAWLSKIFGDYL